VRRGAQFWKQKLSAGQHCLGSISFPNLAVMRRTNSILRAKQYNVEVTILENTKEYVHVLIDVDDGSLPTSFRPLSESIIRRKEPALAGG